MRNPIAALVDLAPAGRVAARAPIELGRPRESRVYSPAGQGGLLSPIAGAGSVGFDQLESSGLLYQIAATRARRFASVQWELVRVGNPDVNYRNDGLADAELWDRPHIADQVFRQPNDQTTWSEFMLLWSMYWDLVGEIAVAPTWKRGIPVELWLLDPTRLIVAPDPNDMIAAWLYRTPSGLEARIQPEELWFQRFPKPGDQYRGMGALSAAGIDLSAQGQAAEWQNAYYENSAQPGYVVETNEHLTNDEFNRLRDEIRENHGGAHNAFKGFVVEAGKLAFTSWSPREMEFNSGRDQLQAFIRQSFGISKTLLGQNEDVNRATADTARDLEAESHTVPKAEQMFHWLNKVYLPSFGPVRGPVAYRYVDPSPARADEEALERDSRVNLFQALVGAGADPGEAAEVSGLPEVEFTRPVVAVAVAEPEPEPDDIDDDDEVVAVAAPAANVRAEISPELQRVQDDWETAVAEALDVFEETVLALWLLWLAGEISDRVRSGATLGDIRLPDPELEGFVERLEDIEARLGDVSADRMADEILAELEDQDNPTVTLVVPDGSMARDTVLLIAGWLAGSVVAEVLRLNTPGMPLGDVLDRVGEQVRESALAPAVDRFKAMMTTVQNKARVATLEAATRSGLLEMVATEELDGATCGPCRAIHGTVFESAEEALAAYPTSGFKDCEGRSRCRGTVRPRRRR